jgi:ATPases involved in chromosome partitioning
MIITIAHNKGGVGKTTLAMNLADGLHPDLIIDQDTHRSLVIINEIRPDQSRHNVATFDTSKELITALRTFDAGKLILIDCGGFDSEMNRISIAAADFLIVPANDDLSELIGLRRFDEIIDEIGTSMGKQIKANVLFNRAHPTRKNFDSAESFISKSKHLRRMNSVICLRRAYPDCLNNGFGVLGRTATKHSAAGVEFEALVNEIKAMI